MPTNFDKKIKDTGENFSLPPRPQVWKRIEVELDKQDRGRFIGWWWVTPVIIIAWGFAFFFHNQEDNKAFYDKAPTHLPVSEPSKTTPSSKTTTPTINATTPNIETVTTAKADKNSPVPAISSPVASKKNSQSSITGAKAITATSKSAAPVASNVSKRETPGAGVKAVVSPKSKPAEVKQVPLETKTGKVPDEKVYASAVNAKSKPAKTTASEPVTGEPNASAESSDQRIIHSQTIQTLPKSNENAGNPGSAIVSDNRNPAGSKTVSHSNANTSVAMSKTVAATTKPKNYQWRFTLGGGVSNNTRSLFEKAPVIADTAGGGGGSSGGGIPPMVDNTYSYSLIAGAERIQKLGKNFEWRTALNVQYQRMKQHTGMLQPYQVDPSPPDWNYSSYYYMDSGDEFTRTGENFRVFASTDLAWALPLSRPHLYVKAGLYGGYNVYNHYLLPDEVQYWWISGSSSSIANYFGGVSAGLEYRLKNGAGFSLMGYHDLNKAFTPLAAKTSFWRSANFTYSLPLNFK